MTLKNILTQPVDKTALPISMLIGATIALIVISTFVLGVKFPDPAWGKLWIIRPLIITPLAGAAGGAFFYFANLGFQSGWKKFFAVAVSVLVYIIGLWMGIVLGLDGTLWN